MREEVAELDLRVNEEKGRIVDLGRGEKAFFHFLGFDFRRTGFLARRLAAAVHTEAKEQRQPLLRKLKAVFQQYDSQPVGRVIAKINPILRGWVNYFRIGQASPVLCRGQVLGRAEGTAALDAGEASSGLRLEEVESGVAP